MYVKVRKKAKKNTNEFQKAAGEGYWKRRLDRIFLKRPLDLEVGQEGREKIGLSRKWGRTRKQKTLTRIQNAKVEAASGETRNTKARKVDGKINGILHRKKLAGLINAGSKKYKN